MSADSSVARLGRIQRAAMMMADDLAADAKRLDSTPLTPRGMGEAFGAHLACTHTLAEMVAEMSMMLAAVIVTVTP